MNFIIIEDKIINLDKIHFVRLESQYELIISFGTDFLKFKNKPDKILDIFNKLQNSNEKLSDRKRR